jgi:hypothetical protein
LSEYDVMRFFPRVLALRRPPHALRDVGTKADYRAADNFKGEESKGMRGRTNAKADAGLRVRGSVKAGRPATNHSQRVARAAE